MRFHTKARRIVVNLLTGIIFNENNKPFISPAKWSIFPRGGNVKTAKDLADSAIALLANAQASGFDLRIDTVADPSSKGMGHTQSEITITNSYEYVRTLLDSPEPGLLPVPAPMGLYNIVTTPQTDFVIVDYKNGMVQNMLLTGEPREIEIYTKNWPVANNDQPGPSWILLMVENGGNYEVGFAKGSGDEYFYRGGTPPVLTKDGNDILKLKSLGDGKIFVETYLSNAK